MKQAIMLGAGGHAREVRDWAEQTGEIQVAAFFDESPKAQELDELPVLSNWSELNKFQYYIFGVGLPQTREKFFKILQAYKTRPLSVIHPSVIQGRKVIIGEGSVIAPQVVITNQAQLGFGSLLNYACTISHDVILKDYVTVGPGANISGGCVVGELSWIGTNAAMKQYTHFPAHSTLGMGSIWIQSHPAEGVYVGNPSELLKR